MGLDEQRDAETYVDVLISCLIQGVQSSTVTVTPKRCGGWWLATRIGLFQKKKQRNDDHRVVWDLHLLLGPVRDQLGRLLVADKALFAKQFGWDCHVVGRHCVHRAD